MNENVCQSSGVNGYERLGKRVKIERLRRWGTVDKARDGTGVSRGAWDNVEHGRPAKELTYSRVELRLGWQLGDCQRIIDGGEPERSDDRTDIRLRIQASNLSEGDKSAILASLPEPPQPQPPSDDRKSG